MNFQIAGHVSGHFRIKLEVLLPRWTGTLYLHHVKETKSTMADDVRKVFINFILSESLNKPLHPKHVNTFL